MEAYQRDHIVKKFSTLIELTSCNTSLLSYMLSKDVFSYEDMAELDVNQNPLQRNKKFYDIIMTRKNSYDILLEGLERTRQTGVLEILRNVQNPDASRKVEKPIHSKSEVEGGLQKLTLGATSGGFSVAAGMPKPKPLPPLPHYYIERRLRSRYNLSKEVFQSSTKNIFVVEGIQRYQLTSLANGQRTDISGNQIDNLTVRHILLEHKDDYDKICKLSVEPVHWIKNAENCFRLVQSTKTVCIPQMYIHNVQDFLSELELMSTEGKLKIISGSPGIGKTMLLSCISHYVNGRHFYSIPPEIQVAVFFAMNDLVQEINKQLLSKDLTTDLIIDVIVKEYGGPDSAQTFIKSTLQFGHCAVLLDAFDEVLKPHILLAKQIIRLLLKLDSTCIYLSTRPHLLVDLENDFHTLGFTIEHFTKTEQNDFFLRYWESERITINRSVRNLARACLTTLAYKLKDYERDIAGIPLQCRLLAEVYRERAVRCSIVMFEDESAPSPITSIFEMYKHHIKLRISEKDKRYKSIIHTHMFYALKTCFPEMTEMFLSILPRKLPISESHILRLGILEKRGTEEIQFVHHPFSEYFIALFALDKTLSKQFRDFILTYLISTVEIKETIRTPLGTSTVNLFSFNYLAICYFINGFMKEEYLQHKTVLNQKVKEMLVCNYSAVSQALIASAYHNYIHFPYAVVRFLESGEQNVQFLPIAGLAFAEIFSNIDFTDLLIAAAMYSDVEIMEFFCSVGDILKVFVKVEPGWFLFTPLHIAIQRGDYRLVEFLVSRYEFTLMELKFLIHFCVADSQGNSNSTVEEKRQIIHLLSSKSLKWVNEPLDDGITPIQQKNVHSELLQCLKEEIEKLPH